MLKEKIQDVRIAQAEVKRLRRKLKQAKQSFRCFQEPSEIVVDNFSGGAHIPSTPLKKCDAFNLNGLCEKTNCKNYEWARGYIVLIERLRHARCARNDLLVEYFWICRKYRELQICRNLSHQADLKRREAFHKYCKTLYDMDDEVARQNEKDLQVAHNAYELILGEYNAARAKFFGRSK